MDTHVHVAPTPPGNRSGAIVALLAGTRLGDVLVWPALPRTLASLPSPDSLGSIGAVLIAGIFGLSVFTAGLFVLYLGLLLSNPS